MSESAAEDFLPTRLTLLSRLRDLGDQGSWQTFFDTYWRLIFSVARKAGLNEAEAHDVVQETVIAVSKQMPEFRYDRARGSFKSWLLTITHRRVSDHLRKRHYHHDGRRISREAELDTAFAEGEIGADSAFEKLWEDEWQSHVLDAALDRLKKGINPLQFQMFHLHVIKGVAVDEVSARLGVKAAEVYWAKYRLGRRFKKELKAVANE
jgi:RNA polymerase sigma factor (sigma-70 family)